MNRRKWLQQAARYTTGLVAMGFSFRSLAQPYVLDFNTSPFDTQNLEPLKPKSMPFELPALSYAHNALEPHFDAMTMEIHHSKHHAAYVNNLNAALNGTAHEGKSLEELMAIISTLPAAVRNNGGGHYNHSLFWTLLTPQASTKPSAKLEAAINEGFGNMDGFKEQFTKAAMGRFGSGWAWLCRTENGLKICSTANQDNPLMDTEKANCGGYPLLGLDVWEHSYYLKYQNRRADYVHAFWNVLNWEAVSRRYEAG